MTSRKLKVTKELEEGEIVEPNVKVDQPNPSEKMNNSGKESKTKEFKPKEFKPKEFKNNDQKPNEIKRDIFYKILSHHKVSLPITYIGQNLTNNLIKYIRNSVEGKCNQNGYIKPDSVKLIKYSSGLIKADNIIFDVVYECSVCNPVEGMVIEDAIVKDITKAGIRAELNDYDKTPLIIFITRDHHYNNSYFSSIKEKDRIKIRIIGQRYELNDEFISVIGELVDTKITKKNRLTIKK